jgi:hypothetical protein
MFSLEHFSFLFFDIFSLPIQLQILKLISSAVRVAPARDTIFTACHTLVLPLECPNALSQADRCELTMAIQATEQLEYESKHVHQVYEEIATHFSATRYKVCRHCMNLFDPPLMTTSSRGPWSMHFCAVCQLGLWVSMLVAAMENTCLLTEMSSSWLRTGLFGIDYA